MVDCCITVGDLAGFLMQIETRHIGIYFHSVVDGCVANKLSEKICNQKCLYKMETHTFLTLRSLACQLLCCLWNVQGVFVESRLGTEISTVSWMVA